MEVSFEPEPQPMAEDVVIDLQMDVVMKAIEWANEARPYARLQLEDELFHLAVLCDEAMAKAWGGEEEAR